jgi:hypothetical protein
MTLIALTTLAAILPGPVESAWGVAQPKEPVTVTQAAWGWGNLQNWEAAARRRKHHRRHRRRPPAPPMSPALASYYTDHGTGACGVGDVQSGYRFASLFLRCGTAVRFCHAGRCVEAVMSDHGPYVSGRTFDLNLNLKIALACSDLCNLVYRVG